MKIPLLRPTAAPAVRVAALAAAVLLSASVLTGCSGSSGPVSVSDGAPATVVPAMGSHLSASDFAAALKIPGTTIVDVRTPEEFAAGHLPGAINANIADNFAKVIATYDKSKPYAVYCRSGNRSGQALSVMRDAGFTQAYDLSGGINAWSSDGGEVVTGT